MGSEPDIQSPNESPNESPKESPKESPNEHPIERLIERLGVNQGDLILEIGRDSDCDEDLRAGVVARLGSAFLDNDAQEVVDAVILWFRQDDGDLIDELVDALTYLSETGPIWLMTPKAGRDGHVEPSDIQDAAPTAGLSQTVSFAAGADWTATKLVARKSSKK
jgi:hypothetical protein